MSSADAAEKSVSSSDVILRHPPPSDLFKCCVFGSRGDVPPSTTPHGPPHPSPPPLTDRGGGGLLQGVWRYDIREPARERAKFICGRVHALLLSLSLSLDVSHEKRKFGVVFATLLSNYFLYFSSPHQPHPPDPPPPHVAASSVWFSVLVGWWVVGRGVDMSLPCCPFIGYRDHSASLL